MKNILNLFKKEKLKDDIKYILHRFPISIIIVFLVSIIFFSLLHWNFRNETKEILAKINLSLIIIFFFSIWTRFAYEWLNNKKAKIIFDIISIIFWILFYFWLKSDINNSENSIFFIITIIWIIWFLFFAPYLWVKKEQDNYYWFFYNLSFVFFISFILWLILFSLWSIAITAILELFDFKYNGLYKLYSDWLIISWSIITPLFALTQLPKSETFTRIDFEENAFSSFIIKYISIPFIYIYFIILYAYSIKVISNFWDWPKGEVSWMVIWFSVFGYIIYIFSYILEEKNKFIKIFRKYFPYVVIPQLFMLFYAICIRIAQYDITTNRYFVVVFGLFLAIISLYLIFSRKKYIISIPIVLTILTIIISIWPWSVYSLPETRQLARLKQNLIKAEILQNWKIVPLNSYNDIEKELSQNIYSWIDYVCWFSNCNEIKSLFPEQYNNLIKQQKNNSFKNNNLPNKWEIVNYITKTIKVEYYFNSNNRKTINLGLDNYDYGIFPLNISWYNKIYKITDYYNDENKSYLRINIKYDENNDWEYKTIEISNIIKDLYKKYSENNKNTILNIEDLTFTLWEYKLIFNNINIKNPEYKEHKWDKTKYYNAEWYVLEK